MRRAPVRQCAVRVHRALLIEAGGQDRTLGFTRVADEVVRHEERRTVRTHVAVRTGAQRTAAEAYCPSITASAMTIRCTSDVP